MRLLAIDLTEMQSLIYYLGEKETYTRNICFLYCLFRAHKEKSVFKLESCVKKLEQDLDMTRYTELSIN